MHNEAIVQIGEWWQESGSVKKEVEMLRKKLDLNMLVSDWESPQVEAITPYD